MNSDIISIKPSKLEVHTGQGKQRAEGTDERRAARMAANFNPDLLHVLTAVKEGSKYLVIDGAHRLKACELAGYNEPVNVRVITGAVNGDTARLFSGLNTFKAPSAISHFIAAVVGGDPVAGEINSIVESHGWTIKQSKDDGYIACIEEIKRTHARGNLDRTLSIITAAYGHSGEAVHHNVVAGISVLLLRLGDSIDDKHLIDVLKANHPAVILRMARMVNEMQGGTVPAAVAKFLVGRYNNRRRSKLLPESVWTR